MKLYSFIILIVLILSILLGAAAVKSDVIGKNKTSDTGVNRNVSAYYHSYHEFLSGGIIPAASFLTEQDGQSATDALSTGLKISSGSIHQNNALAAYLESSRPRPATNGGDVAGYFSAKSAGANTNIFGINPLVSDTKGFAGQSLQNELDFNVADHRTHVQGLGMVLNSRQKMSSPPTGFVCRVANTTKWDRCFWAVDGSADVAMAIGTEAKGNNVGSMPIVMNGRNANGQILSTSVRADRNGSLLLRSGAADGAIGFQDAGGANTGYINADGMVIGKSVEASSFGGSGNSLLAARQGAGKGATTSCSSGSVCDSFSGTITLKTGQNISGANDFLSIKFSILRNKNPNCNVTGYNTENFLIPQFGISIVTKDSITLRSGAPLASSSLYSFTYICAGS